ncbi:MAG: response regulator [Chloroflexi bacterium]|nr:response regulator [Chloroflexota bacterium]MCI0578599.1 response regulator [Chloroflexota bacterium]MCI0647358.1 response regulator [Chloroflexota bacterium]MCI0727818.1 response regulator [Chloroflexota bacterium]
MAGNRKIVFVEDEQSIVALLRDTLLPMGIEVIGAARVEEGVAAVRQHDPELVVLDLMLPVQSGWALVDELRADERYAGLPIIVYTSRERADETALGGRINQVQEYINKPRSILELRDLIQKYLRE